MQDPDLEIDARGLGDRELVAQIEADHAVPRAIVDEYYRRCIPLYLDFLGAHWHTGFYRSGDDGVSPRDQARMVEHIADLIGLDKNDRVLDVGCGIGATLCQLNRQRGCEAVGLTPVPEQKAMAERLARQQRASIRVDLGHAERLPYADDSFDVLTFFESPCHFANRQAFFDEACRVLRPGGRLAGEDWLATDLQNRGQRARWIEPICKAWAIPMLGDAGEYRRLMAAAGFADISIVDMRTLMPLEKGFATTAAEIGLLRREIEDCAQPLLALTLEGLIRLGRALDAGAFTIGRISAIKPGQAPEADA